jgi:hypothetical protein
MATTVSVHADTTAPYVWKSATVGGGGFSPNIIFSPAERGLVYLRTDIGGAYRRDETTKRWMPLEDAIAVSDYMEVESLAPDPHDPNTVFLAAGTRRAAAILRSRDRGAHWTIFPTTFRMGGNEDGRGVGERLVVDPCDTSRLYFGSRYDGLKRSTNAGESWESVSSFPIGGRGLPKSDEKALPGLSFVVLAPQTCDGRPTRTIIVGVADSGSAGLYRSDDAGSTWRILPGTPDGLVPMRADVGGDGLFATFADNVGPNGARKGAVLRFPLGGGTPTDISPEKGPSAESGGYSGVSVDRHDPKTLLVSTLNRWKPGDTVWRSTDGGNSWRSLRETSTRDVSAVPYLRWGDANADFGWWIAAVAIDPFDARHAAYTTGATIYETTELDISPTVWRPWVDGVEETAIITLTSPSAGPHLLSGIGDIGGFVHDDFAVSPPGEMFTNPIFSTTDFIDFAAQAPNVVVRSGTPGPGAPKPAPVLAYSEDFGRTWNPLVPPAAVSDPAIAISSDGTAILVTGAAPMLTRDRGAHWSAVLNLPPGVSAIADREDAQTFYAVDFDNSVLLVSHDGGAKFTPIETKGLPDSLRGDKPYSRESASALMATPSMRGDLWYRTNGATLFHSRDGGASFAKVGEGIEAIGFGKGINDYPTLFAIAWYGQVRAVWLSLDQGTHWLRVNDDSHEFGRRFRCVSGDPRVFGRVYLGTDGRGIQIGDVVATPDQH